jgi:hypothetical protein
MQSLVNIEIRCPKHDRPDTNCAGCSLAAQFQQEADTLRARRASFMTRMRNAVRAQTVAIVDFK